MVNVQTKPPVPSVVIVVSENAPSVHTIGIWRDESKVIVAPDETLNPDPVTVNVAPAGPWLGVTRIVGVVTVNVPPAVWPPTSVAVTVDPDVPLGTLNVQLNDPVASVVSEPIVQLEVGITTPSKASPTRPVNEKPVPDTVTVAPKGPCPGVTAIAGVVTANVPPAV
jgi:hypothetical protein